MKLSPQEYCDICWKNVSDYAQGVNDGSIVSGKYIKKLVKRYQAMLLMKDRFVFRVDKVDKVFKFFSLLKIEHRNEYTQPILLPWQCLFISMTFGFYYKSDPDKRVIREVFLFIARKNGKTLLSSALQLYFMVADGVESSQSLLLANVSSQASIALNFAKNIVNHTPELKSRLVGQRSRIIFRDSEKQGFCQTFSTVDPVRIEGYNPQCAICDELHGYMNNAIPQSVRTGFGARRNPMLFMISSAGNKNNGFLNDYLKYQKDILDEKIEDYTMFPMIFQVDEEDDLSDPKNWVKSNPSLGLILDIEDLITSFNSAKYSYADKYFFYTKHLNIFVDDPDVWIPEDYLLPLFEEFDESQFYGQDVFIGMDLSKNTDLSSIVVYIPNEGGIPHAVPYFWLANMEGNMIRRNGKDLSNWIFDGHIHKCDTKTIDLDLIYDKIIELSEKFNIVSIGYDPYNSPVLVAKLKEYGLNCEKFQQNASKFNAPMKMLEEMVYNKKIKMKNPCLLWNFNNVVLYLDGNANVKIVKNKQNDSVDGCVALAMAIGQWVIAKFGEETMGINQYLEAYKT